MTDGGGTELQTLTNLLTHTRRRTCTRVHVRTSGRTQSHAHPHTLTSHTHSLNNRTYLSIQHPLNIVTPASTGKTLQIKVKILLRAKFVYAIESNASHE